MVISLIGTGLQIFLWVYILIDFIFDTFVRLTLGMVFSPLAWLAIWAFKLPTFPIILMGWFWRILIELIAFPIQGWMLFFGGSGCFLRWGHDCWFAKRIGDRSYWQIADLPVLMMDPTAATAKGSMTGGFTQAVKNHFDVNAILNMDDNEYKQYSRLRRETLFAQSPAG